MAADTTRQRWLAAAACALLPLLANAFEPGRERICEPSADGRRFECRDKATGAADPVRDAPETVPRNPPSEPVHEFASATPEPRAPAFADETTTHAPATSTLPDYLRSTPSSDVDLASEPEPVADTAASEVPAIDVAIAEPAPAAEPAHVPEAPVETAPAADVVDEATTPAHAAIESTPPPTATMASALAAASAFRQLDARRYTLELARADRREALLTIADGLGQLDGTLHLVALRAPHGTTWRLFWSDFGDIDEARAARTRLPAGFAGDAVWPRRIGPLQAELISP